MMHYSTIYSNDKVFIRGGFDRVLYPGNVICKHVVSKVILVLCSVDLTIKTGQSWSEGGDNKQCGQCNNIVTPRPTFQMSFKTICIYVMFPCF